MQKLLVVLAGLLLLATCEKEASEAGLVDFDLQFTGVFDDSPLQMYEQTYAYADDVAVRFQLFQFYISDLVLLKEENGGTTEVPLADIELISFADIQTAAEAAEGVTLAFQEVPAGNYTGLKMGLGVSPDLNATQPGDYDPPHPLDNHYWSWARGYVFTKVEGNADLDGDGVFEEKLTFHIGENDYYRELEILQPIEVRQGGAINLKVDLANVLQRDASRYLNFREVTQDHTTNPEVATLIADNLLQAITYPQR